MDMPVITLSSNSFPEVKKWKVGDFYKLEIIAEQIGAEQLDYMEGEEKPVVVRLRAVKVHSKKAKSMMDKSGKALERDIAKMRAGGTPDYD